MRLPVLVPLVAFVLVVPVVLCDDQENINYVVEVLAVIDKSMVSAWKNASGVGTEEKVLAEVKSLFYEVNIMYQSLQRYNLSVEVRLKDVVFPNVSIVPDSAVVRKTVRERQVSSFFGKWLRANRQYTYDHAMIMTNWNMKGNSPVNGVALTAAACRREGTSRVRGRMDYSTAITVAHELGHSLGARHDSNKKKPCLKGYVMSPSQWPGSRYRFYFSPCSADNMRWYITKRLKNKKNRCLLETTSPPIVSKRMGEIVSLWSMCSRHGKWVGSTNKGDDVCKKVKCRSRYWSEWFAPPEGIPCGSGKQCFMGYCV
ncbi:zinc metalloproteinase/disintegrin [Elysia marginata]|uniref:Zinc metalloproteinase/disintegrin n=1 Tax=Elysia marginata TaxID=1093978 RepID=A0AAV4I0F4_9GAST|nr:zinc metalloproteinase/disintegrin [Elysia marginata]